MAGSLVQIDKEVVTTATSEVILTGINTDDVYFVTATGIVVSADDGNIRSRVTLNGVADVTSNYDRAGKQFKGNTTFTNSISTNDNQWNLHFSGGNSTGEINNFHYYAFNFNNANKYSSITCHESGFNKLQVLTGQQGAGIHTVNQSCNGFSFIPATGNITAGNFVLYKVL